MSALDQTMPLCVSQTDLIAIDRHILGLKAQRNSLVPVAKLPTEIMSRIFFLLARPESSWSFEEENWNWLELTRICRAWRKLALGCATLWAEIKPSYNMKKVEVFLERSGRADLDIELGGYEELDHISSDILNLVSLRTGRVRGLRLITKEEIAKWDTIQDLFRDPMPRLRRLHLIAGSWDINGIRSPTICLNRLALFTLTNPLESLSLCNTMIPWNSPLFYGLSELNLGNIESGLSRPTVSELLEILAASPNLRELGLQNVGPRYSRNGHNLKRVALPNLRNLSIEIIEFKILLELFEHLDIPKDIGWTIEDVLNPFVESKIFPTSLLDSSVGCSSLFLSLNDCSLSIDPYNSGGELHDEKEISLILNDEHTSTLPDGIISFFQSLEAFFKLPFFANVTRLVFEMLYINSLRKMISLKTTAWTHLFAALPELQSLDVWFPGKKNSGLEDHLLGALLESTSDPTGNVFVCSKLKSIRLNFGRFSTKKDRKVLERFLSNFVLRRQNGKGLKTLKFDRCYGVGTEDIGRMKDLGVADEVYVSTEVDSDSEWSR